MTQAPHTHAIHSYYRSALLALRHLDASRPTGRRFGPEADARWNAFRGHLTTADRIDLLIRDANAQWPEALGARTAFAFDAVSEDDPFGPDFPRLDPVDAEDLWRTLTPTSPPATIPTLIAAIATAWNLALAPFDPGPISPTDRLVVVGPGAIAATLLAFASTRDLDWIDQVIVIATPPAPRQLAALAAALLGASRPTPLHTATTPVQAPHRRLVASPDALPEDLRRAQDAIR